MTLLNLFLLVVNSFSAPPPIIWGCSQGAQLLTPGLCTSTGAIFPTISGTDNKIVRMDGTTGLQDSALTCDDQGNITGAKTFDLSSLTADRAIYGDSGKALTSSATTATQLAYLSNFSSALSANGDLYYHNGTNVTRIPRGADNEVLTSSATSIGWEAVAGGSGFSTIDAPSGTDPVAGTTLTLTSTSTDLTITGNSATDTVDFDVNWTNPLNDSSNECFGASAVCGTNGAGAGGNTAFGNGAVAGDTDSGNSTSIGASANCSGNDSVCIGAGATGSATVGNQVLVGASLTSTAASVINVGSLNTCDGSVCIGQDADGLGSKAINIGESCDSEADTANTICIGQNNTVGDGGSAVGFGIAIGTSNTIGWGYGIAIGRSNNCSHASFCGGRGAVSTAHGQIVWGGTTTYQDMWLGAGVSNAAAVNSSINVTADTGTNIAGHSLTISSGAGTGTGANTSAGIAFRTPDTTGSGTTSQTLTTKMEVKGTGVIYFTPKATAPATCVIGDMYVDTSGAYCACSVTNTWENMTATGTCA